TFDITIEQPQGSIRRGVDANGKAWESKMHNTYGYIRGTEGVDGDHIDVFLTNDMDSWNGEQVFVIDQYNEDGTFDEHKVMLGFNDIDQAYQAYLSNYEKGWEKKHNIVTTATTADDFNKWIDSSHRKTKPFADYKSVKTTAGLDAPAATNGSTTDSYTITPTQYTTKRGNVLDMHLVKFNNDLTKEQYRTAKELAKADKGWYDREQGGFMMRSQESAQQLADTIASQPISITDIKALNDGDIAFTEPQQSENKPHSPIWQYSIHVDTDGYTVLTREDVSSGIAVGDAHFSPAADSPEEMLEILRDPHNNMQEVLDAVGVIIENKIKSRELDRKIAEQRKQEYEALRANGVNGYKIGEKVIYKGKKATIHDFEEFGAHQPILDTGMAPVIYEVAEWSDIKKPQQNQSASSQTGQDLTTGYSIDNDAETSAKVVISNQGAKHELNNIIHKYAGQRKTRGFISDLARALGDRRNEPRQTYYFEFTDKQGNSYTLRISNHNANANNANEDEKEISIVIKSRRQPNKFIAGNADVREYVYFKESIANGDGQTLAWIAQDIATMLDTGVYEDNSGIAILNTSPTNPTNQGQFGLVSDDRMAELKERLRRKLGGQMNIGIDPEILSIGLEIAVGHIDRGIKSFTDFARVMIADLGDTIRPYLKAFYNGARDLPEVIDNGLATDMTPYDEVKQFDITNFDRTVPDLTATATNIVREAEVANEVNVAKQRIKRSTEKKKSLPSSSNQLNLFDNTDNNNEDAREQDTRTNNSRTQPRREELPETESVEPRTPLQHTVEIGRSKRGNTRTSGNQLGDRPLYDVNKNYSNEEISQIVSSVTDIVDGRVVITAPITDDIRAICHQYKSGGVAKKGHGILDEYYTDGKIVDAVSMLITPYFNNSNAIRVLEPSVGVGNFISAVDNIPTSEIVTFEINPTTARIAKILYPGIDVNLRSFETEFIDDAGNKKPLPQKYNLIIGNPPYGSHRGLYKGLGEESKIARYEDYFVKRSLDVLNEGGVLAMVLPSSWIDRHTRYGGYTIEVAYRLPSGAFEATQVGTDIVVLRKDSSIPTVEHIPYFYQHPGRILGEVKQRKGRYGKMEDYVQGDIDTAIEAIKRDHAEQLANSLDIAPSNDNLNNIEEAIDETGSPDKATAIVQTAKDETNNPAPANNTTKKSKYKTELNRGA
ncbi:MAG: Eco57I restriction-modification methylase domain-containing protein, partial [Bacteroidaceae bacterium]|nr:Eco57I restriction-modification methylase domain-containing protein [Bacteroidaceae bacterium]